jgi:2-iminobutanoate/2-iminopropanoate deaminase
MLTETIAASDAPKPGGAYAQAIRFGDIVVLSGQVGVDPATGRCPSGVAAQTRRALLNLAAVLGAAGGSLADLIKTTCFLASVDSFAEFNAAYEEAMGSHRPARSTVGVNLPGDYLVEIEGIAVLPRSPEGEQ